MTIRELQPSEIATVAGGGDDEDDDIVVTGTRKQENNQINSFDLSGLAWGGGNSSSGGGTAGRFGVETWTLPAPPPPNEPVKGDPPTKTIGGVTYSNGNSTYGIGADLGFDTLGFKFRLRF